MFFVCFSFLHCEGSHVYSDEHYLGKYEVFVVSFMRWDHKMVSVCGLILVL